MRTILCEDDDAVAVCIYTVVACGKVAADLTSELSYMVTVIASDVAQGEPPGDLDLVPVLVLRGDSFRYCQVGKRCRVIVVPTRLQIRLAVEAFPSQRRCWTSAVVSGHR